jgi:hypothetical protein
MGLGCQGEARGQGIPPEELEAVVGDLDAFIMRVADGEAGPESIDLERYL